MKVKILLIVFFTIFFLSDCKNTTNEYSVKSNEPAIKKNIETIHFYLTAKNTNDRLSRKDALKPSSLEQPKESTPTIMINWQKKFQTIEGFGGAFTDAAAETFYKLPEDKQQEIIKAYFDKEAGIGYTFCRTHINSCDFSSKSYAYTEVKGDTMLEHFSIDQDKKYRIPLIKEAFDKAGDDLKLFASPWSPPAWMKTNNNMLQGGKLIEKYKPVWADYYIRFIKAYEKEGIPIWGLTVQNEPMAVQRWESCIYTAQEERDFVKNHLGPALHKVGMQNKKLMVWDHNRGIMPQRAQMVFEDPEASKYVWGTGFHWYVGDHFDNIRLVHEAYPDKKLVFTEGCVFPFNIDSLDVWHWGERYGESILMDLNNWTVAWTDWNILLNEKGGPNHVHNYCYAPIIGNTKTGEVHYMNSYYYMGHFSKFIRPGARRILCSSNYDDLLATAFINPDNSIAVVVLNLTNQKIDYQLWFDEKAATINSPEHSIMTLLL